MRALSLGACTATKEVSTVLDLLPDESKGSNYPVWGKEDCVGDTQEAVATAESGLAMDGWEQQTCEAPTSPVQARNSESSSRETSGALRRRSSILRPRRVSSDSV